MWQQVDRNFGRKGGWLLSVGLGSTFYYSEWSAK